MNVQNSGRLLARVGMNTWEWIELRKRTWHGFTPIIGCGINGQMRGLAGATKISPLGMLLLRSPACCLGLMSQRITMLARNRQALRRTSGWWT
jgi:hypothetical protein